MPKLRRELVLLLSLTLFACGGGGGSSDSTSAELPPEGDPAETTDGDGTIGTPPDPTGTDVPNASDDDPGTTTAGSDDSGAGTTGTIGDTDAAGDTDTTGGTSTAGEAGTAGETTTAGDTGTAGDTDTSGDAGSTVGDTDAGSDTTGGVIDTPPEAERDAFTGSTELMNSLLVERFDATNYQQVLSAVIRLSDLDDSTIMMRKLRDLEAAVANGTSALQPINIVEPPYNRLHICPDGGRLLATVSDSFSDGQYVFDNCQIGGDLYTGQYSRSRNVTDNFRETKVEDTFLMIGTAIKDSLGSTRELSGLFFQIDQSLPTESVQVLSSPTLRITDAESDGISIARGTIDSRSPTGDAQGIAGTVGSKVRSVSLNVRSLPRIADAVKATTVTVFAAADDNENYQQGQLVISFDDRDKQGNRIVMQAANGDPDSFDVFVFEDDDSVQSFTINWSDQYRFDQPLRFPD